MLRNKAVIVLGAGASKEIGLPLGSELKLEIADIVNCRFKDGYRLSSGDALFVDALKVAVQRDTGDRDINPHLHAGWHIHDAMPQASSIDNFIDVHNKDKKIELCGKLGISRAILAAEAKSRIFTSNTRAISWAPLDVSWLNAFMRLLVENCPIDQLAARLSAVTFVVFNYDRCLEHFLYHAIQNYYRVNSATAASIVNGVAVFHPYGTVGVLPWQQSANPKVEYGAQPDANRLADVATQIKTFTEGTDPGHSDIVAIRRGICEARTLIFLGFAFHRLNLELMLPRDGAEKRPEMSRDIYGTATGMSEPDCSSVIADLCDLLKVSPASVHLRSDRTARTLFDEYWRTFSMI